MREVEVARVRRLRGNEPEAVCGLLDAERGTGARDERRKCLVLRLELELLLVLVVQRDVRAQDCDVQRDDAGEQHGEERDPDDAAREPPSFGAPAGSRARLRPRRAPDRLRRDLVREPVDRRHYVFTAARRRADEDRGFAATSAALGLTGRRSIARSSGSFPQTHTGKSGGHVQPRSFSRRNCLTMRSSSEWNEITASRPPGRSIASAAGSAASSEPSSSLTAIRSAWKTRFAGWPSPKRAGAGIAALIVSTSSPVRSNGVSRRRRTIAFAICRAYRSSP